MAGLPLCNAIACVCVCVCVCMCVCRGWGIWPLGSAQILIAFHRIWCTNQDLITILTKKRDERLSEETYFMLSYLSQLPHFQDLEIANRAEILLEIANNLQYKMLQKNELLAGISTSPPRLAARHTPIRKPSFQSNSA